METVKLLLTSDVHQYIPKWDTLVEEAIAWQPAYVLIAGDHLPKEGFESQRSFFPKLKQHLQKIKDQTPAEVITYFGNDDAHVLEPLLDQLANEGLCHNLNQKVWRSKHFTFCGMPMVRDYPFGYKHWCAPDGAYVKCPVQFSGEGVEINEHGQYVRIPDLQAYLTAKDSLFTSMEELRKQAEKLGPLNESIWMVHGPPAYLGMDICGNGERVGSPTITQFIKDHQPLVGISGHIHESPYQPGGQWHAQVGDTHWFQPGQIQSQLHSVKLVLKNDKVANYKHSCLD